MKNKLFYVMCFVFVVGGLLFFISEFITALHSADSLASYYLQNISELLVPFNIRPYSALWNFFSVVFYFLGATYLVCYNFIFKYRYKTVNIISYIISVFACVGIILVASFYTKGEHQFWHVVGSVFVFVSANSIMLLTALFNNFSNNKIYRNYCIISTIVGALCGLVLIYPNPFPFKPIIERLTIYPFIIFQIVTGIYLIYLKFKEENNYITNTKKNG